MKTKEFLRELLHSIRRGPINRFLRFVFFLFFLFFSFLVGRDLIGYVLKKRAEIAFNVSGLRWSFNPKNFTAGVSFNSLELRKPGLEVELYKGRVELNLLKSLTERKLFFSEISVVEAEVESTGSSSKGGGEFKPVLPFYAQKVEIDRAVYTWPGGSLLVNGILFESGRQFFIGGLEGLVGSRELQVEPTKGYFVNGELRVPRICGNYGGYSFRGSLAFRGVRSGWLSFGVGGSGFFQQITVNYYGKSFSVKSRGTVEDVDTQLTAKGKLEENRVQVTSFKGKFDGLRFKGSGEYRLKSGEVKFAVEGKGSEVVPKRATVLKRIEFRCYGSGKVGRPEVDFWARVKELQTPQLTESNLFVKGKLRWPALSVDLRGNDVSGRAEYSLEEKRLYGSLNLKKFSLNRLKALQGKRIEGLLSGPIEFSYSREHLNYRGRLKLEKGKIANFAEEGEIGFRGGEKLVRFSAALRGDLELKASGFYRTPTKELNVDYSIVGNLSKVVKSKSLTLSGSFNLNGQLEGRGRELFSEFSFSGSPKIDGVSLGDVAGSGRFSSGEGVLVVSGYSTEGIVLRNLTVNINGKEFWGSLLLSNVDVAPLSEVAGRWVKGVEADGKVSGELSFSGRAPFKAEELSLKTKGFRYSGRITAKGVEVEGVFTGNFEFKGGELFGEARGEVGELNVKGKEFGEGEIRALFVGNGVKAEFSGFKVPLLAESSLRGRVEYGFNGRVQGEVKVKGEYRNKFVEVGGGGSILFGGVLPKVTVKFSGKFNVNSPYLERGKEVRASGSLLEPEGLGTISLKGEGVDLKVVFSENRPSVVGVVRELKLKLPKAKGLINMAFVQLDLSDLTGRVAVPAFTVKPQGFYRLYSVSGIYLKLKKGKVQVSDFSLSYVDGWIESKELSLYPYPHGKFKGKFGIKGLVYLAKAYKFIPFVKGAVIAEGSWGYNKELHYRLRAGVKNASMKVKYVLEKIYIPKLEAAVEDGAVERLSGEVMAGDGSAVITTKNGKGVVTLSDIPIGEVGVWKSFASGELHLNLKERGISGTVNLSRTKVLFHKGKGEESGASAPPQTVKLPVKLNIKVLFLEPVKIQSELFWVELVPSFNLKTANQQLKASGSFYITGGQIDYMGKKFKVLYGSGVITDLLRKRGRISLIASSYINGYYVYMKIEGSLQSPQLYLTSDPPLTREQILNLIMTGASPEQVEASSEIFPAVQVAYYATATFFKPVEEQFQKILKLESFSVEPYITRYGETVAKITVSKKLTKRIRLVGYETTGQNPEYGGSIQFYFSRKYYLEIRYNSYYGPEAGIGFRVRLK